MKYALAAMGGSLTSRVKYLLQLDVVRVILCIIARPFLTPWCIKLASSTVSMNEMVDDRDQLRVEPIVAERP